MNNHLVAPSLLAADFSNLKAEVEMINASQADWIHLDIMDGHFVPNLSFGLPIVEAVAKIGKKPLDVHLMISEPEKYIPAFIQAGANHIIFHYEATTQADRLINLIRESGCKAGIAINPQTPVSMLEELITKLDIVCLMSVNPGFGGQTFIPHTFQKIRKTKTLIKDTGSETLIEVDGGIAEGNIHACLDKGADVLVVGTYIFHDSNPALKISSIKNTVL